MRTGAGAAPAGAADGWRTWPAALAGEPATVFTRPGALDFAAPDPAAHLLAALLATGTDERVLNLNCGSGLVGLAAARRTTAPTALADANLIEVQAARQTLAAAGAGTVTVAHSSGLSHLQLDAPVDLAAVRLPKGRLPALQLIWDAFGALRPGGRLLLGGGKGEGIQPALASMAALFGNGGTLTYRKGYRVGQAIKQAAEPAAGHGFPLDLLDHRRFVEFSAELRGERYRVLTRPGVFAWEEVDDGTRLLVETMVIPPGAAVLDLGCGSGLAGAVAARLSSSGPVVLVDVDILAVESARRTVAANGLANAVGLASDGVAAVAGQRFDVVISNPPFHVGQATAYDAAEAFIAGAAGVLRPGGCLYLVANRFLPYERTIRAAFGQVATSAADGRYKVLSAVR